MLTISINNGIPMSSAALSARYSNVDKQKSAGITYTPKPFAEFLAKQILSVCKLPDEGSIQILDPACGDGTLLAVLITNLPTATRKRLIVTGFDTEPEAVATATTRLTNAYPDTIFQLEQKDFLEYVLNLQGNGDLFSNQASFTPYDLVIANPPYVRTQVMGARQAQQLAQSFNLSGRVDLYYPFILGISSVLAKQGTTGVITSNRFMTTKSGQDVRREMLRRFQILKIWDMGDTKLFDAAVLPSVFIAKGDSDTTEQKTKNIAFSSIYETKDAPATQSLTALDALAQDDDSVTQIPDGRRFRVRHGLLANGKTQEDIWRITTEATDNWLKTVEKHTWATFSRIGKIRVGVKSTADKVFLRSDWDQIAGGRPELLKPLITRKCARRFKAQIPENPKHRKEILYPHQTTEHGRSAVDLSLYPKSAHYLTQHREALEKRKYLIEAGRNWYELWVPQDPAAWSQPKLVFPDIAEKPIFWLDTDGGVVNGECYWLQCKNNDEQGLMWLALAVANSSFIETFYDHRFNNKLYAGKRRFITQYVELFPLPQPDSPAALRLIALTREIYAKTPSTEADILYLELDKRIWEIFGLNFKKING